MPARLAAAPSFTETVAATPLYPARPEAVASDTVSSSVELPDDPSSRIPSVTGKVPQAESTPRSTTTGEPIAKLYTKYIPAGWDAQPLTARDKIILGLRDTYSPSNFSAMILSAAYEQVRDGKPNYGVGRDAFGERLGAAAIRETTQGIFTDAVFAPLLHEDPRYYVEGKQFGIIHRVVHAVEQTVVTRTDNGSNSVNGALLLGYASSSALAYTYYPAINRNAGDLAATFGSALGGAALHFIVCEFSSDVWAALHLQEEK